MVAVITRHTSAGMRPVSYVNSPEPVEAPARPHLVLIPGGRSSSPPCAPAGLRVPVTVGPSLARRVLVRTSHVVVQHRGIIACCLLALTVVAGCWMVLRAIGGVAGGGSLTSSGALASSSGASPVGGAAAVGAAAVAADGHPTQGQTWVVRPGDTLWGIVEAAGIKGDPRPVVDKLSSELGGRPLQVGETISVPDQG
jgi:hypothetical protein